jgi:hypothetical protein
VKEIGTLAVACSGCCGRGTGSKHKFFFCASVTVTVAPFQLFDVVDYVGVVRSRDYFRRVGAASAGVGAVSTAAGLEVGAVSVGVGAASAGVGAVTSPPGSEVGTVSVSVGAASAGVGAISTAASSEVGTVSVGIGAASAGVGAVSTAASSEVGTVSVGVGAASAHTRCRNRSKHKFYFWCQCDSHGSTLSVG